MTDVDASPSARQVELLEAAYRYALDNGLADVSLRPLAAAVGSSPRVLLYLFGSKDGLIRALLARARAEELAMLAGVRAAGGSADMATVAGHVWSWLAAPEHRPLLALWTEAYARSLIEPNGAWAGFARSTVQDWLTLLADAQPAAVRSTPTGCSRRTAVLALLRGALLDLLATGDLERTEEAVRDQLAALR
jgi:AcrR family transcriptional regulator